MKDFIGERTFIIAEIGANHSQNFVKAASMIYAAAEAGADAVKIQMFTPDSLTLNRDDERFKIKTGLWSGKTLYQLYQKAFLSYAWVPRLKQIADGLDIKFLTSVYDVKTLAATEKLGIEAYKVASFEVKEIELLKALAETKKPVIISTGGATEGDIARAKALVPNSAFLKCTSKYPTPPEDVNLKTLVAMRKWLRYVGLSDHTTGIAVPVAAVALGARIIEKHFKIDEDGLDSAFSINPKFFEAMVAGIRTIEKAMGRIVYGEKTNVTREIVDGKSVRTIANEVRNLSKTCKDQ